MMVITRHGGYEQPEKAFNKISTIEFMVTY